MTLNVQGAGADGIDHDRDIFYLWLNAVLTLTVDPQGNLHWVPSTDGPIKNLQWVTVGQLKNPNTMSPGTKRELDKAGVTAADYAQILSVNPFSHGSARIDPDRFVPVSQSFPYEPPPNRSDPGPTQTYNVSNTVTKSTSHSATTNYSVSFSGGVDLVAFKLTSTTTFSWSNTATSSSSQQSAQSASVTIGGPAHGYAGPTNVRVYWDTIYKSFMFAFGS